MKTCISAFIALSALAISIAIPGVARANDNKGKTCTMEQQCRWENFKKICTWVKVCR
jgi:hypothetical protein